MGKLDDKPYTLNGFFKHNPNAAIFVVMVDGMWAARLWRDIETDNEPILESIAKSFYESVGNIPGKLLKYKPEEEGG